VDLEDAVVLVTGGSRGIGRATSELLARRGADVVIAGRDPAALQEVAAGTGATAIVTDLRPEAAPAALVEEVLDRRGRLDAVVCNAGVGFAGPFPGMGAARIAELVDVDLRAPVLLSHRALAAFRRQALAGGHREHALVFVTSIAGLVGVPGESVYSAVKAGLEAFAALLREELRTDPVLSAVRVATVAPGVVDTEFFLRRGAAYGRRFPRPQPPARVASAIVTALEGDRPRTLVPPWLALPARLSATFPGLYRWLARRLS
jgi:NAD(P)-dependent dehydrogenase (short-subunit alcohol dehydrogenase family)